MPARRLPSIKLDGGLLTVDFRTKQIRYVLSNGEIKFYPLYDKVESMFILHGFFSSSDGRDEFIRYRKECIRDGDSTEFLDDYMPLIARFAEEI
jgi:hypothetical protein